MTVTEYLESNSPFRFVHANHDERIHEKVKNSPDDYEVVRVRRTYHNGLYFIEVREINKKKLMGGNNGNKRTMYIRSTSKRFYR